MWRRLALGTSNSWLRRLGAALPGWSTDRDHRLDVRQYRATMSQHCAPDAEAQLKPQEDPMTGNDDLAELRGELAALRASHELLLAEVTRLRGAGPDDGGAELAASNPVPTSGPVSRRNLLRLAAVGAGGLGLASTVGSTPAVATVNDLVIGGLNVNSSTTGTTLNSTASNGAQVLFQSGSTYGAAGSGYAAAVAGWASHDGSAEVGVYAFSEVDNGIGIAAVGIGSGSIGGVFSGESAALSLPTVGGSGPPTDGSHAAGEIQSFEDGLWLCVMPGGPGTWRRIQGGSTAGSFTAISAVRVFDSRLSTPLAVKVAKPITVVNSITPTGATATAHLVPVGATAITGLLTSRKPSGAGELQIYGAGSGRPTPTNLAFAKGETLTTSFVVKLGIDQRATLWSNAKTDVTVDVTGYYM
jgi:hypothetical protein